MRKPFLFLSGLCLLGAMINNWPASLSSVASAGTVPQEKIVYLTLDADMSQGMASRQSKVWYDQRIFDYLQAQKIPAAFFVSGLFVLKYPDLMQALAANPLFSFQNHSYDESGFTAPCYKLAILKSDEIKIAQIKKTQAIIQQLSGMQPQYFRFPGLCRTAHDDDLVRALGLKINEGDILATDPFNSNKKQIVNNVLRQLHSGGTILMHVGGPNAPVSYEALLELVPKLRALGYTFQKLH